MKTIAQLRENLARIAEVESAKRQTVVQHHAAVPYIQRACGNGEDFAEILAH